MRGSRQCSHMLEYAALVASPRALPDGLILVFQHPVRRVPAQRLPCFAEGVCHVDRSFFRYWLPLISYCALIFMLSSQPVPEKVSAFFGMDKLMHAAAWMVLGILCFRGFQSRWCQAKPPAIIALSVAASVLFGISDEFHQSFVPSRTPT